MWREKAIRWGWWLLVLNTLITIANIYITYGHWTKHEIIAGLASSGLALLNGWVAWRAYTKIRMYRQEIKEKMWNILQTPSGELQ